MAVTGMFVIRPVSDLDRATAFYTAIGFTLNPAFSDHNAACLIVEEGHSYFMIETREFFQTHTELTVGDPAVNPTGAASVFVDSKQAVDEAVTAGIAAGGAEIGEPADYGFMYQRGLADPDGNVIDFGWMDPVAAEKGPEAYMSQQA